MSMQETEPYKEMPFGEIALEEIPDRDEFHNKESGSPKSIYFMKVGNIAVKCSYAKNKRCLEDCLLSYLKKKAGLMDG